MAKRKSKRPRQSSSTRLNDLRLCDTCAPTESYTSYVDSKAARKLKWLRDRFDNEVAPNQLKHINKEHVPDNASLMIQTRVPSKMSRGALLKWWAAEPRKFAQKLTTAAKAYCTKRTVWTKANVGASKVGSDGTLIIKCRAPQPYYDSSGQLYPPHVHVLLPNNRVLTVAAYPCNAENHKVTHWSGRGEATHTYEEHSQCSIVSQGVVQRHMFRSTPNFLIINALPKQYANVWTPNHMRTHHLHIPYTMTAAQIALHAKKIGDMPYVVYCEKHECNAATELINKLVRAGACNVYYMPEGRVLWTMGLSSS